MLDQRIALKIKDDLRIAPEQKLPVDMVLEKYSVSNDYVKSIRDIVVMPGRYFSLAYPESRIDYLS